MEPHFGHDFSGVRVHTGAEAGDSARAVNALAYTVGRDVVFGAGRYAPQTKAGLELLAHELTHVIHQGNRSTGVKSPLAIDSRAELEREADANSVLAPVSAKSPPKKFSAIPGGQVRVQRKQADLAESTSQPEMEATDPIAWKRWEKRAAAAIRFVDDLSHYGCFCGKGDKCSSPKDDIDKCCQAHDTAYEKEKVNCKEVRPGCVSMWEPAGLKKSLAADLAITSCLKRTFSDGKTYSGIAKAWRTGGILLYGAIRPTMAALRASRELLGGSRRLDREASSE